MKKGFILVSCLVLIAIAITACGSDESIPTESLSSTELPGLGYHIESVA
jgi:hypothetical protein